MIIKDHIKFRNNLCHELENHIPNKKYALNLEKAIYNYTVSECTKRKIIKKWENPQFVLIYIDHFRTIYNNFSHRRCAWPRGRGINFHRRER